MITKFFIQRRSTHLIALFFLSIAFLVFGCSDNLPDESGDPSPVLPGTDENEQEYEAVGSIPHTVTGDVFIAQQAVKLYQLTGDYDRHLNKPTLSQIRTRFSIEGTDLGVPFKDGENTWFLFGDTWGPKQGSEGLHNVIGYTSDKTPEEVESFSVLKDAAARAVYGVRGANGVIMINTKRGKIGKTNVDVRFEKALTAPVKIPDYIGSVKYVELINELNADNGRAPFKTEAEIWNYKYQIDPEIYPDVDWWDVVSKDYAEILYEKGTSPAPMVLASSDWSYGPNNHPISQPN